MTYHSGLTAQEVELTRQRLLEAFDPSIRDLRVAAWLNMLRGTCTPMVPVSWQLVARNLMRIGIARSEPAFKCCALAVAVYNMYAEAWTVQNPL